MKRSLPFIFACLIAFSIFKPVISQGSIHYDHRSFLLEFNSQPDTSSWFCNPYLNTGLPTLDSLNSHYGVIKFKPMFRILQNDPFNRFYVFGTQSDVENISILLTDFQADPNIGWTQYNYLAQPCYVPNDLEKNNHAFDQYIGIDLYRAFDMEMGHPEVIVGLADFGIEPTISELQYSSTQHNIWVNPGEDLDGDGELFDEDDIDSLDNDNNGFIDDLHGWNFVDDIKTFSPNNHGTMMGSAIAAYTDNAQDIIGVAGGKWGEYYGVKLLPIQVSNYGDLMDALGYGIQYCDVINMSIVVTYNSPDSDPCWVSLMIEAQNHDCLLIAGAGNEGTLHVYGPANSQYVMAVAATDEGPERTIIKAGFSSYGPEVDICAIGVDVPAVGANGNVSYVNGTSISTAQISGVAALLKCYEPTLSYQDIWDLIINNARDIYQWNPQYDEMLGSGQADAYLAISAARPPQIPGNLQLEIVETHPHLTWDPSDPDVVEYQIWREVADRGNVLEPWGLYDQVSGDVCEYTDALFGYCPSSPWTATYKVRAIDEAELLSGFSNTVSTSGYIGIESLDQFSFHLLGKTECGSPAFGMAYYDDYIYINLEMSGLKTYDVSDPANPVLTDFISSINVLQRNLETGDGYLFAPYGVDITAYDLTDPAHPLVTSGIYGNVFWGNVFWTGTHLIGTAHNQTAPYSELPIIYVYEAVDPVNPSQIWEYWSSWTGEHAVYDYNNDILYAGGLLITEQDGFVMADLTNPSSPLIENYIDFGYPISIDDQYLWCMKYVESSGYELRRYETTDPYNLAITGVVPFSFQINYMDIIDDFAVVSGYGSHFYLYDISDRLNWVSLDSIIFPSYIFTQLSAEGKIYITAGDSLYIYSVEPGSGVSAPPDIKIPTEARIVRCSPNPFNSQTTVRFSIPQSGKTVLTAYDILGREIAVIFEGYKTAGEHKISWNAQNLPSGIYFIRLDADGGINTLKILLIK